MQKYFSKSPVECLKLLVEAKLSYRKYVLIRQNAKKSWIDMYAPYYKFAAKKSVCMPGSMIIRDHFFEVDALDAISLTAKRLLMTMDLSTDFASTNDLVISVKIGIDGARSGTQYAHFFNEDDLSDEYFLIASFAILDMKMNSEIIYLNGKPNSERNTR